MESDPIGSEREKIERARGLAVGAVGPGALLAVPYGLFFAWGTAGYGSLWDVDPLQFLQFWFISVTPCMLLLKLRSWSSSSIWFYGGLTAVLLSLIKVALLVAAPFLVDALVIAACQELDKVAAPLGTALLVAFLILPAIVLAYAIFEGARAAYLSLRAARG